MKLITPEEKALVASKEKNSVDSTSQ